MDKIKTYLIFFVLTLFISGCVHTISQVQGEADGSVEQFISERIKLFSEKHFTKIIKCEVVFTENQGSVQIEYIPDFGSIIFKNEIWQWSAAHALNLIYIFPEIKEYQYLIYDKKNNKLMELYLDEAGINSLPEKFYGSRGPGDFYRHCFTRVEVTKIGNELPLDENFFEGSQLP